MSKDTFHCNICDRTLLAECFTPSYIKNNIKRCRDCDKSYHKKHRALHILRLQKKVNDLKESTPCKDCGHKYPHYVTDYDHLDSSEKLNEVSRFVDLGWTTRAFEEIAKCELICANCHRARTYKRRNSERAKRLRSL